MSNSQQVSFRLKSKDINRFRDFCEEGEMTAAEGFSALLDAAGLDDVLKKDNFAEARKEIDERISSGEDIRIMFASAWNENECLKKAGFSDSGRTAYLEAVLCILGVTIAAIYMKNTGWEVNESGRYMKV